VVFDLSAAYGKPPGSIRRGAALIGRQMLIQDEIGPEVSGTIEWLSHTTAEPVSVAGSVARFRSGADRFVVRIVEPVSARFDLGFPPEPRSFPIADVRQLHGRPVSVGNNCHVSELPRRADACCEPSGDALVRRLQITWPKGIRRLSVALLPDCDDDEFAMPVVPLAEWLATRPPWLTGYRRPRYWTGDGRQDERTAPMQMPAFSAGLVRDHLVQRNGYA